MGWKSHQLASPWEVKFVLSWGCWGCLLWCIWPSSPSICIHHSGSWLSSYIGVHLSRTFLFLVFGLNSRSTEQLSRRNGRFHWFHEWQRVWQWHSFEASRGTMLPASWKRITILYFREDQKLLCVFTEKWEVWTLTGDQKEPLNARRQERRKPLRKKADSFPEEPMEPRETNNDYSLDLSPNPDSGLFGNREVSEEESSWAESENDSDLSSSSQLKTSSHQSHLKIWLILETCASYQCAASMSFQLMMISHTVYTWMTQWLTAEKQLSQQSFQVLSIVKLLREC